ncbi:MAG: hypothetical protein FWC70_12350, partial [Defluviitaleaceae bacterium]|nr:hypothetical protein [Defluviitaleaceae bacterium]
AGMIPKYGEVADGLNAVLFLAHGEYADALSSTASMIPVLGTVATGARLTNRAIRQGDTAVSIATGAARASNRASDVTSAGRAANRAGGAANAGRMTGSVPADGIRVSTNEALDMAGSFLGPGYREIAPGVFRSADGARQVRMTTSDLARVGNHHPGGPHLNFETGRTTVNRGRETFVVDRHGNSHVFITE